MPLLAGLLAVVAAAALVVYLQHQSAREQEQRTALIVRQVCERSASAVADRLRERFGGAVLHTIEAIGHREFKAYNLARVDECLAAGARAHPYVTRFFMWHERLPRHLRDEVVFHRPAGEPGPKDVAIDSGSAPSGGFFSDPARGRALWRDFQAAMALRKGFGIEEVTLEGVHHQVVVHFFWDDGERSRIFGMMGFLVDLEAIRRAGFEKMAIQGLESMLNPSPDFARLALEVRDESGRAVYGSPAPATTPSGSEGFDLLFFPRQELENYVARMPAVPRWQLTVRPAAIMPPSDRSGLWLLGAVVLLLFIAVLCAVSVNRQAIRLSELQSDFVANVSHQLRTPLAMVSAAAETLGLERVRSPEKVKEYAAIIKVQAERLSGLVDQILHFNRTELAGLDPIRQPVDLGELVARAADQFRALKGGASLVIRVERPSSGPIVHGDPVALEYAVVNLLENAVKYGHGTANEVTVAAGTGRGFGVITVRDTGIGISRADLPHVFDKFYRGAGQARSRGFGLGLAIVRSTVTVHGGRVAVTSTPGQGSEFTVLLPLSA